MAVTSNGSEGVSTLEMYLYAFGFANLFKPSSCSLNVRDHNGDVPVVAAGGVVVVSLSGVIFMIGVLVGLVVPLKFFLKLVKCPVRKLTSL